MLRFVPFRNSFPHSWLHLEVFIQTLSKKFPAQHLLIKLLEIGMEIIVDIVVDSINKGALCP